jgi:hypothetical protein
MKTRIIAIICIIVVAVPRPAWAWSECGHAIITLMVFDLLTPTEQQQVIALMRQHPRYTQDFVPPEKVVAEDEQLQWQIGRIGYWADVARRQPKYDRPTWHYELGAALVIGEAANLQVPERPGALPEEASLETQELHIAQATDLCLKILADKTKPDADRAVALCWIAHLVADAHQPCHAGSLYMEGVFAEPDGDRGANRILVKQRRNMHALWDQLLGDQVDAGDARRRISEIESDEIVLQQALLEANVTDPRNWLQESRELAVQAVYVPEVLDSLTKVSRKLIEQPEVTELDDGYLKKAVRVAQVRAAQAAMRLQTVIRMWLE